MKKILALLLSGALLMALLAGCGGDKKPADDPATGDDTNTATKEVVIGVFEPSSGDNGAGGKQETLGMQYANSITPTVDIGGETYKVKLVYSDNASDDAKAPTAAQKLIDDGAVVILGSYGSSVSTAASPIFASAGVPAIGVTCTNPGVTQGNKHYFRICFLDPFQGTVQANFARDHFKAETAYCLAELGNEYDMGLANYFVKAFNAAGGKATLETFPKGTTDFTTYLTSAKNAGADVIFAPCAIANATQIIDQAASQGNTIPLMAGDTWDSNKVVEMAQGKNVEIYVSTFYQEGANKAFDDGFKEFLKSDSTHMKNNGGNDMISAVSAMGYDAYYVALEAMKAAGSTDPKAINEALWDVKYEGVSGAIAFEQENGDAIRDTAYIKSVDTTNNNWKFVAEQGIKSAAEQGTAQGTEQGTN